MDTRNRVTRQWLSQQWEQAARRLVLWGLTTGPYALTGGMPQEAKALGNARDMQTWGRHARWHGCRKSLGLRRALMDTGCPSVLKTGYKSDPDCACAKHCSGLQYTAPRVSHCSQWSAYNKGSCDEEPRDRETITRGSGAAVGRSPGPLTAAKPTR